MGGIGKTTLAQYACNNYEVKSNFKEIIWVCVSNHFDEFKIARVIIEALKVSTPNVVDLQSLLHRVHESISGKKFLVVLNDVWNEEYNKWEPFYNCLKNGLHGSKILITTREKSVACIMNSTNIMNVKELSYEENWLLFRKLALSERPSHECEKLEEIGREIVKKCKGLPLATKTIGSLLRFKRTNDEWQRILNSEMWKLEEIEKGLLSPLMLSYNDLPSSIRQCFSYCAVFPKDYNISKDELIKLWMAQGYLGLEKDAKLETIGEEYFHYLATRSFFQDFSNGNVEWGCKMHDIVHDFALFLSNGECLAIEVNGDYDPYINSSHKKVRHLMLKLKEGVPFPMSIYRVKSLRSLIIFKDRGYNLLSSDVFKNICELTGLRSLIFPRCGVEEIPKEIKNLIHLRYLDLSGQDIVKLPESLCELYNLHTLDITGCRIHELPEGIEKLVNLRRLVNEGTYPLLYIPKGIQRLTALRTLSKFVVSGGGDHDNKACMLEGLKILNHLEGSLGITGLGNLTNLSDGEMKEVLKNKKNLTSLSLNFDICGEGERLCEDDELVLEALQPPPRLEWFSIGFYRGSTFPSAWTTSLTKLQELHLHSFSNCKTLHPSGKLPSLELLNIRCMENVKEADYVFWGLESGASSSSDFFPKLKQLEIWDMEWEEWGYGDMDWEEWDYGDTESEEWGSENTEKGAEEEENIRFMPCLATLAISYCPQLLALPNSLLRKKTLKELEITECPILEQRYDNYMGVDWPKIRHIPNVRIDFISQHWQQ